MYNIFIQYNSHMKYSPSTFTISCILYFWTTKQTDNFKHLICRNSTELYLCYCAAGRRDPPDQFRDWCVMLFLLKIKITFQQQAVDISIVFIGALPCFSSFTCRRVIVWSVVCCASLILALKNTCLCSLLTLCLAASGSYEKRACHKTTFHINRLSPLVETVAAMSHDLCANKSLFTQHSTVWKIVQFIQTQVVQYG